VNLNDYHHHHHHPPPPPYTCSIVNLCFLCHHQFVNSSSSSSSSSTGRRVFGCSSRTGHSFCEFAHFGCWLRGTSTAVYTVCLVLAIGAVRLISLESIDHTTARTANYSYHQPPLPSTSTTPPCRLWFRSSTSVRGSGAQYKETQMHGQSVSQNLFLPLLLLDPSTTHVT